MIWICRPQDQPAILRIADAQLGKDSVEPQQLGPDCLVLGLVSGQVVQAFCIARNSYIAAIATAPEYTGRGIGSRMLEAGLRKLLRERANRNLSWNWTRKTPITLNAWENCKTGKVNLAHVAERTGFEASKRIEKPYEKSRAHCPACGEPPCQCDAILYVYKKDVEYDTLQHREGV